MLSGITPTPRPEGAHMTRKDYEAIAERIAQNAEKYQYDRGADIVAEIAEDLAEIFADENPRFDRDRFIDACGVYSLRGLDRK
jgi:hypothetical protein